MTNQDKPQHLIEIDIRLGRLEDTVRELGGIVAKLLKRDPTDVRVLTEIYEAGRARALKDLGLGTPAGKPLSRIFTLCNEVTAAHRRPDEAL